jgi:ethanolamine ammonia-lyase large subunit
MLNYQSASFHDILYLRSQFGLPAAPEFEAWLQRMDLKDSAGRIAAMPSRTLLRLPGLDAPDGA